jgi:hypothetical protein
MPHVLKGAKRRLRVDAVLVCASCGKQTPHDFHFPSLAAAPVHKCQLCGTTDRPVRRFVRPTRGADDAAAARAEPVVPLFRLAQAASGSWPGLRLPARPGHPLLIQVHHDRASARCLCGWGLSNPTTLKTVHDGHRQHAQKAAGQGGGAQVGEHTLPTLTRHESVTMPAALRVGGASRGRSRPVWERAAHRRSGLKRPKTAKDTMRGSARKGRQRSRGRRSRQ